MEKKNLYNVLRLRMTDTDNNKLLIEAVKDGKNSINFNIICRLLEEGVDVNAKDEDGITALMWAICKENKYIVEMLLKKGADVNAKDKNGISALTLSAMSPSKWRSRKREIVSMLLEKGADVNTMDSFGLTAVMWAYKDLENFDLDLVSMLRDKGADDSGGPIMVASSIGDIDAVKMLLDMEFYIDKKDNKGWTALMYASFNGHSDIVSMLIAKGADVDTRDNKGFSALDLANSKKHTEIVSILQKKKKEVRDARPSLKIDMAMAMMP